MVTGIIPGYRRRILEVYSREEDGWLRVASWDRGGGRHLVELDGAGRLRARLSTGLGVGEDMLDELLGERGRRLVA